MPVVMLALNLNIIIIRSNEVKKVNNKKNPVTVYNDYVINAQRASLWT